MSERLRVAVVASGMSEARFDLYRAAADQEGLAVRVLLAHPERPMSGWRTRLVGEPWAQLLPDVPLPVSAWQRRAGSVPNGLWRALRAFEPDLLLIEGASRLAAWSAYLFSQRWGVPYLLLRDAHELGEGVWGQASEPLVRLVAREARLVLVGGAVVEQRVLHWGVPTARVRRLPPGVPADAQQPRPPRAGDAPLTLLVNTRWDAPRAWLPRLFQALAGGPTGVLLAGAGSQVLEALALARGLGVPAQAVPPLVGAERHASFARADALLVPAEDEQDIGVALEGMAHGVAPVVSMASPLAGDLVHPERNGVLADFASCAPGFDTLRSLDVAALRRLGAAAQQRVATSCAPGARARRLVRAVEGASGVRLEQREWPRAA